MLVGEGQEVGKAIGDSPPQEILWFTIKETVFSSHLSLKFMPSIYFLAQIPYILEIWDESVLSSKGKKQKPQALCGLK